VPLVALLLSLSLSQAERDLGRTWERRAPRDLATIGEAPPAPPPPEIPARVLRLADAALEREIARAERARDDGALAVLRAERDRRALERDAAAEARRAAGEASAEAARDAEARRAEAEARLRAGERALSERLAASREAEAAEEEQRLRREARIREISIGGAVALVLAGGGGLAWRSLRRQR
jgi:hypothetical protein